MEGQLQKKQHVKKKESKFLFVQNVIILKDKNLKKLIIKGVYIPAVSATCLKTGTIAGYQCKWCEKKLSGLETLPVLEHD